MSACEMSCGGDCLLCTNPSHCSLKGVGRLAWLLPPSLEPVQHKFHVRPEYVWGQGSVRVSPPFSLGVLHICVWALLSEGSGHLWSGWGVPCLDFMLCPVRRRPVLWRLLGNWLWDCTPCMVSGKASPPRASPEDLRTDQHSHTQPCLDEVVE